MFLTDCWAMEILSGSTRGRRDKNCIQRVLMTNKKSAAAWHAICGLHRTSSSFFLFSFFFLSENSLVKVDSYMYSCTWARHGWDKQKNAIGRGYPSGASITTTTKKRNSFTSRASAPSHIHDLLPASCVHSVGFLYLEWEAGSIRLCRIVGIVPHKWLIQPAVSVENHERCFLSRPMVEEESCLRQSVTTSIGLFLACLVRSSCAWTHAKK